jgi:hypothetical protein
VNATDYTVSKHESAHAAAGILVGRQILSVKRYGQHGIAAGHGVTTFVPIEGDPTRSDVLDNVTAIVAGILWEPRHGLADVKMIEHLRSMIDIDAGADAAYAMVRTEEFVRVARAIESELVFRPWLSGDDVQAVI